MKLSTWNKPNSNEVRVYFNGMHDAAANGLKVFAVQSESCFEVRFSGNAYNSVKDAILDRIDSELEELNNGERVLLWTDLLALVK